MRQRKTALLVAAALAIGVFSSACAESGDRETVMPRADGSSEQTVQFVTAEFEVDGMSCGGCALATELALKKLDGVASAVAEYDDETGEGRCTVEYDPALVSPNRLITTINDVGFVATPLTGTQGES